MDTRDIYLLKEEMGGIFSRLDQIEAMQFSAQSSALSVRIPAANQLRNGDFSHSVNTWSDATVVTTDRAKEAIYWHSHDAPTVSQQLNEAFDPTTPNKALKSPDHSAYDPDYSDWDKTTGIARLNGTKTIDAPLPGNLASAGRTEEVALIAARRTRFIEFPETCRMYAGIWDNTAGQRDWISDAFTLTASVTGTPAGTTERRYKIFVETDKGVSFLSDEVIVTGAPNDASFGASNVLLRWKPVEGILRYVVYRYTPSTGIYKKLEEISNGSTTYIDLNTSLSTPGGYPTADYNARKAVYFTNLSEIANLAIDGVSVQWSTIAFPIVIPDQYQQSATTDKQWVRLGLTETPNLLVPDCTTNGTSTIVAPEEVFSAEMVGLTIELSDGTNSLTTTIATFINATRITVTTAPGWSNAITQVRVIEGGFFAVLVDLVHCGYQKGNLYAPHPEDIKTRVLQPAATPDGSTQGGTGIPPPIETEFNEDFGGIRCVTLDTPIRMLDNYTKPVRAVKPHDCIASGNLQPNVVNSVIDGMKQVREVRAANGAFVRCTDTHRFIVGIADTKGIPLFRLRVGDAVLTEHNGRPEMSRITEIGELSENKERVRTLVLINGHFYCAGEYKPQSLWDRLKHYWKPNQTASFFSHNRKAEGELYY